MVKEKSLEAALDKAWPEVANDGDAAPAPTAPAAAAFAVGDRVQVQWKGAWYPAKVLKVDGEKFLIHYDGSSSSWDEWVAPSRIKK